MFKIYHWCTHTVSVVKKPDVVSHTCYPVPREAEAGGSRVLDQFGQP